MNGHFLSERNQVAWEKAEIHEDFSYLSYDTRQKKIVWRQFHSEGFVHEYTLDSISADGKSLEFSSVRIENIPPETIQYLNRLSDAMFVWSRWVNNSVGAPEVLWQPNEAASAHNIK